MSTVYVRAATFGDYSLDLAAPIGAKFLTDNRIEASIGVETTNVLNDFTVTSMYTLVHNCHRQNVHIS